MNHDRDREVARGALLRPFTTFFALESASGILLLGAAAVALIWANSPWAAGYAHAWETPIGIRVGAFDLTMTLHHWVNDGLMALFFFVVGLEIKREVVIGELSSPRKAALPIAAAIGGMLVPAVTYFLLNRGGEGAAGWGIPMATDIAFALGVLALLGRRVPVSLRIFITAVAIVDDLGAVIVIALFYTADLSVVALGWAAALFALLIVLNSIGVRRVAVYAVIGLVLWFTVLESGIHATIAGVLLAMTIPTSRLVDAQEYLRKAQLYVAEFAEDVGPERAEPTTDQRDAVYSMAMLSHELESPLARLEHTLHPVVAFAIMPIFALANAGVALGGGADGVLTSAITLGVVLGLVLGKQIGVLLAAVLAVRSGLAELPEGATWRQLWGVAILCGIGFTMSLFIGGLAFDDPRLLDAAKIGVLLGSLISGLAGALVLLRRRS